MGEGFVHADGGSTGAAAHIRGHAHLKQPLNGAVLPVFAMEHREEAINGQEGQSLVGKHLINALFGVVRSHHTGTAVRMLLPLAVGDVLHLAGIEEPLSFFRNADADDLILIRRNVCDHRAGRDAGDLMFGRCSSEQDGDSLFCHNVFLHFRYGAFLRTRWSFPKTEPAARSGTP